MTTLDLDALERAARAFDANRRNWQAWDAFTSAATCDTILSPISDHRALQERVEGAEKARDEWQAIETAPKDGTSVLVAEEYWVTEARWVEGDGNWWRVNNDPTDHWGEELHPTHWRPLPEPPARTKAGEPHEQE